MTVTSTQTVVTYTGDGTTFAYAVPFEAMAPSDLYVAVNGSNLQPGIQYNVTGDITQQGATVVFGAPPGAGARIDIRRLTKSTQESVYTPYGPYRAKQIEADFDRAMMLAQEERDAIDNPPPIVFPTVYAEDVVFVSSGHIAATNVQDAIYEANMGRIAADALLVPKATPTYTLDSRTLTFQNSDLSGPLVISARVNTPFGLLQLDGTGKVPNDALAQMGLTYVGVWSVGTNGATPPASGDSGDMYIFTDTGTMQLREPANTSPHDVLVDVNDYMVWTDAGADSGYYYVHNAQVHITWAVEVQFIPSGSLASSNVQAAIQELDATLSERFRDEGNEIAIYRQGATGLSSVLRSYAQGVRIVVNDQDRFTTQDAGASVYGFYPSTSPAQITSLFFNSSDGLRLGSVGYLGDRKLYLHAYRGGDEIELAVTGVGGGVQTVLHGTPDGSTTIFERGQERLVVAPNQIVVRTDYPDTSAVPVAAIRANTPAGVDLYRMGFLGSNDFYIAVDRPGAPFRIFMANGIGEAFHIHPTTGMVTVQQELNVVGNTYTNAPAPTQPNHLTRKDYVDSLLTTSGFVSSDLAIPGIGATGEAHNLGVTPTVFGGYFVCVTPQAGYGVGHLLQIPHLLGGAGGYCVSADASGVYCSKNGPGIIIPFTGGGAVSIIEANWRIRLFARK